MYEPYILSTLHPAQAFLTSKSAHFIVRKCLFEPSKVPILKRKKAYFAKPLAKG